MKFGEMIKATVLALLTKLDGIQTCGTKENDGFRCKDSIMSDYDCNVMCTNY